ncbi:MAG TPA: helix-turn-helix transcriptional regulator [Streptosporangiaceae bacterium]
MATSSPPGSAVIRIRLGARLRRLREARGITAQQAASAIRASDSKISRIELGRHAAREIDVSDLLTLYGVTDPDERDELLGLASDALAPPWWHRYADVLPPWFQTYLGVEEAAISVQSYDSHFVPGLLQTAAYSSALIARSDFDAAEASALLAIRAERISRFAAGGWRLTAIIDEAVLRRPVGRPSEFAAQLEHLRDAAGWPGVSIRIRPLSAGAPPVPAGFTVLRFSGDDLSDVVFSEQLTTASYLDRPADVARYTAAMSALADTSAPPGDTAGILASLL